MSTAVRRVATPPEPTLDATPTVAMSAPNVPDVSTAPPPKRRRAARAVGLLGAVVLLVVILVLSIAVGAKSLPLADVWSGLLHRDATEYAVVHRMRLPRTLLGLLAGTALGVAGAVMQALTRNPLADPGLLGINAGASAAVAVAATFLGVTAIGGYVWFALLGAALVTALVYAVGGGRGATPARLALAGAALNATLYSFVSAIMLLDTASLDRLRFWTVGSLASADSATVTRVAPFILVGLLVALGAARPLNALALGDDAARALGARPAVIRAAVIVAVTLLCGAATAACGPIVFVGLLVPHLVRAITGPDLRWLLPYCAVLAPVLLLGADVLGRVLGRPGELQVGMVTAVLGGPLFLWLVTRSRVAHP
ncbi:Ferric enterobactin transport system permease protein fepD [Micromonospora lupini str. Lupac 08]|uniref:Ferric enterobactin transport system permease protein fepD n=2 Tax=Micromonospora lupini TaxID=285679 RepID=I0L5Q5_9ACTN|nr:Ferric enterobactin transport system permease protein fepD [Micromonospora lupini str. Lupac 08]